MSKIKSYNLENKTKIAKLIEILYNSETPDYLKKMCIDRLLWATTEHDNAGNYKKYNGQPFWSIGALKKYKDNIDNNIPEFKDLRHEHAVPKKEIRTLIDNLSNKTEIQILNILDTFGHSVVVSKEEDEQLNKNGLRSRMPKYWLDNLESGNKVLNVFSRYKVANIKIYNISKKELSKVIEFNEEELEKLILLK